MKLINYALQTQIETLSDKKSQEFFKDYIRDILEDSKKPYFQKADYVGLSLNTLKSKIDDISLNIKELQTLKKKLTESLDIAKALTANVLLENGIDRIDGNIISSLTLTKATSTSKQKITVLKPNEVMGLGYVKFSVDDAALEIAIEDEKALKELSEFITIENIETNNPSKIKINTKKSANTTEITTMSTDEILQLKQAS